MPVATQAEATAWAAEQEALTTLLAAEFATQAADLATLDPTTAAGLIRELSAEVVSEFGSAAALLSAEWYEELRPSGSFTATLANPDADKLQADLSWAMRDLFGEQADLAAALSRSIEVSDLAVTNAGRETVIENLRRDPLDARYARHASPTACAFCALLATAQATYRSEDTAGIKPHRKCHCIAVPVWPGQQVEEAPYVADWRSTYYEARNQASLEGPVNSKTILKQMRLLGGLR